MSGLGSKSFVINPGADLAGTVAVPGDKSISHRSLMLGAIANGRTRVSGFLPGEDCLATLAAMRAMGVSVERVSETEVIIDGVGLHGLKQPDGVIDLGNSGTAMRLMMGLLAGQGFQVTLTGDESLSVRPMERVAKPLRQMSAGIDTTEGKPPVVINAVETLSGIHYEMPMASAQVKSAVLLAGLYADGETSVREPAVTRDHTERMLQGFGVPVEVNGPVASLRGGCELQGMDVQVPADISSATFPLGAGCISRGKGVTVTHVGVNPTRTGILDILKLLGASIEQSEAASVGGEPVATLTAAGSSLKGCEIPPYLVPLAIDEFPMVFALAALAEGETLITGAEELRAKESDRISAMVSGLQTLGVSIEELPDGAKITGGPVQGGVVDSLGDHRIAMAFAVLASHAANPVTILNVDNVATSFPGFVECMQSIGLDISEISA